MFITQDTVDVSAEGFSTSKKAYISDSNVGIIFDTLSKSFYSDPIGSIVREITNNCIDAFVAAGLPPKPVLKYDKANNSIHFIDEGTGLTPTQMEDIFLSLGESSKRQSTELIGAFGLGSKSVFAYTNSFYITTRVNGIEYQYLYSRASSVPDLDLLFEGPTDKVNGTTIWFPLKPSKDSYGNTDYNAFVHAIDNQLRYVDSVQFEGFPERLNNFTIYRGENFVVRETHAGFSSSNYTDELELCYGQNVYPINWNQIKLNRINFKGAITFDLDSGIRVTPNREQLIYDESVIKLVKDKIAALKIELQTRYDSENRECETIFEYYKKKDTRASLKIGKTDYSIHDFGISSSWIYKPVKNLELKVPNSAYWLDPYTVMAKNRSYASTHNVFSSPERAAFVKKSKHSPAKNSQIYGLHTLLFEKPLFAITSEKLKYFYPDKIKTKYIYPDEAEGIAGGLLVEETTIPWMDEIETFYAAVKKDIEAKLVDYDALVVTRKTSSRYIKSKEQVSVYLNNGKHDYMTLEYLEKQAYKILLFDTKDELVKFHEFLPSFYVNSTSHKKRLKNKPNKHVFVTQRPVFLLLYTPKGDRKKVESLPNVVNYKWFFESPFWPSVVKTYKQYQLKLLWDVNEKFLRSFSSKEWKDELKKVIDPLWRKVPHLKLTENYLIDFPVTVEDHPLLAKVKDWLIEHRQLDRWLAYTNDSIGREAIVKLYRINKMYKKQLEQCKSKN